MTPEDLAAIRERDVVMVFPGPFTLPPGLATAMRQAFRDRRALLAEVDRLTERGDLWRSEFDRVTAENQTMLSAMLSASRNETTQWVVARIRAAVEGLPDPPHDKDWGTYEENGWDRAIAAVLAAIDGGEK